MTSTEVHDRLAWSVRLRRDATLTVTADGVIELASALNAVRLPALGSAMSAVLRQLANDPCTDAELTQTVIGAEGTAAAIRLQMLLRKLDSAGWLEHGAALGETQLATLRPLTHVPVRIDTGAVANSTPRRLSRFAVMRAEAGTLVAESPLSSVAVDLLDPRSLQLVALLAGGTSAERAAATIADLPVSAAGAVLDLLAAATLLTEAQSDADPEAIEQRLAQWSATDLLMHATSRFGRRGGGHGGTYWLASRFPALPAIHPTGPGEVAALPVPDLAAIAERDPRLTDVIEQRRSLREHDDAKPITVSQLGELLYRTVRIRQTTPSANDQLVDRPYPAGGSLGELEFYAVAARCDGLAAGVWHYDAVQHQLDKVADPSPSSEAMLWHARTASLMDTDPQVLIVVTARFGRVMWKYEAMAYALILKHVGVVYQTLYLVATAMGLAPCAQGLGSADLFATATGLDYYDEGSVGEFIVGSRAGHAKSMWEDAG